MGGEAGSHALQVDEGREISKGAGKKRKEKRRTETSERMSALQREAPAGARRSVVEEVARKSIGIPEWGGERN